MTAETLRKRLEPGQIAFHFSGGRGINADELGKFLREASKIANRENAVLEVIAIEPGSISVVFKTVLKNIKKEVSGGAIALSLSLISLYSQLSDEVDDPFGKVAYEMVASGAAKKIEVVTAERTITIMDQTRANDRADKLSTGKAAVYNKVSQPVKGPRLYNAIPLGTNTGYASEIDGKLYFRPDSETYFVPITLLGNDPNLTPGKRYRIEGSIVKNGTTPHSVTIRKFTELQ